MTCFMCLALTTPDRLLFEEEARMARVTIELTPEKLAELLGDLSPEELKIVLHRVAERLEIREWIRLGESGLRQWLNEPDLYADDPPAR